MPITLKNVPCWRLDQTDQEALFIPVGTLGGDLLFDVFLKTNGLNLEYLLRQLAKK